MIRTDFVSKEKLLAADLNAAFVSIKGSVIGSEMLQYNEAPLSVSGFAGVFRTAFPYRSNAMSVYLGTGVDSEGLLLQVKDLHYSETTSTDFTFISGAGVSLVDSNATGYRVRVNYMRSDV